MNMRINIQAIILLVLSCLLLIYPVKTYTQGRKAINKVTLNEQVNRFLLDYVKYGGITENGYIISPAYENQFADLFTSDATLYNDLDLGKKHKKELSPSEYIQNIKTFYPNGLKITVNNLNIGKPKKNNNGSFKVFVYGEKEIFGYYKEQRVHRDKYDIHFTIQFNYLNGELSDFKISSIKQGDDTKLSLSILAASFYSQFLISNLDRLQDYSGWKNEGSYGYQFDAKLQYAIKPFFGIGAGVGVSNHSSEFSLEHLKQESYYTDDVVDETYYLWVEAENIKENFSATFLSIPLFFRVDPFFGSRRSFIFLEAGIQFLFGISSSSDISGSATHEGYYPQYHVLLYDIPQLGFYTNKTFTHKNSGKYSSTSINGYMMIGFKFPLFSPNTTLNLGFQYARGLNFDSDSMGDYYFSEKYGEYNSLLNASSDVKQQFFGTSIGVSIGLN